MGAVTLLLVTLLLLPFRNELNAAVPALLLVLPVLASAAIGGRPPAVLTAFAAAAVVNLVFLPPYGTFRIALPEDVVALAAFMAVATTVGTMAAGLAERRQAAEQRALEIEEMTAALQRSQAESSALQGEAARARLLEEVDDQRAALLRSVSHDLRTPLATIRAVTSDLRSGIGYDEETRGELLDIVGDEAERLDRLVANLLSLSRIESGAMTPERQAVDLEELIRDRVGRLARLFDGVRVVVDVPGDLPLADADYTQLDQVLTNLLENAARHAPSRSQVIVSARAADDGLIHLRVQDEGIGVAEHERQRVFEPFRRGEGSRSSGIGLAICKAVIDAHGGWIRVDRTPGGGATFVVALPLRRVRHG